MVEVDSSILGETPIDGSPALVTLKPQCLDLLAEGLFNGDAPVQDSPPLDAEFDLRPPSPTDPNPEGMVQLFVSHSFPINRGLKRWVWVRLVVRLCLVAVYA